MSNDVGNKALLFRKKPSCTVKMYNSINPAINIKPDPKQIVSTIENLVKDKQKLFEISKCSRKFIEIEHDYIKISEKYIKKLLSMALEIFILCFYALK